MNQQEILEYNERCAEFLGAIYSDCAEAWGFGNAKNIGSKMFHGVMYHNIIQAERFEKELKFHSDWNWVMEVVEAIEKLNMEVSIIDEECGIIDTEKAEKEENPYMIEPVSFGEGKSKKEAVVQAINQFLIWHEKNKS